MHGYFEGWYLKQQAGNRSLALIPAIHTDRRGNRSASIQVITRDAAETALLDGCEICLDRRGSRFSLGDNCFSGSGFRVDLRPNGVALWGSVRFGPLRQLRGDIMGPFRYVPFMECRHSLFSLFHQVDGQLTYGGETYCFDAAPGYWEGDRGASFPTRYIWSQCAVDCWQSASVSVATIPFLGGQFTGVICAVCCGGSVYRLATYYGARVRVEGRTVCIRQGDLRFYMEADSLPGQHLQAPVSGGMDRRIREALRAPVHYRLERQNAVLLDLRSEAASLEWEW